MIPIRLQVLLLTAIFIYFILVFQLLRRKTLNLKYTLLWLVSGLIMLVLALFPSVLQLFTVMVGISTPVNALFSVVLFCVIIILMSLTAIVSKLNEKSKILIQSLALLEKRVRELEKENTKRL